MSKQYEQQWFASSDKKHKAALYIWRPETPVRGVVQVVHGMREHMGRYADFAAFLNQQGFAVCGHDQLGHGRSAVEEEELGYFGKDGCRVLLKDCHRVTRIIGRQYPYRPIFMLGHSMGSFIARLYILHHAGDLAGFICMGTSGDQRMMPYGKAVAALMAKIQGERARGTVIDWLAFSSYLKRFQGEESPSAWISRDASVSKAFDNDSFCRPCFTNGGFSDMFTIMLAVSNKQWAHKVDKTLPILLVSGTDDPVGQYGKGVVQVYERLKMAGVLDVKCKLYPGARHELLNELNKEEVYYDLLQWIEGRLPARPGE